MEGKGQQGPNMGQETLSVPPQAIDAERALLGSALISKEACRWMLDHLADGAFYREAHEIVFKSIRGVFESMGDADIVLVAEDLKKSGKLGDVGGVMFLKELQDGVASHSHVEHYGRLVLTAHFDRLIIRESSKFSDEDKRDEALRTISQICRARDLLESKGVISIGDSLDRVIARLKEGPVKLSGTEFDPIDKIIKGSESGDLVTVGARTGVGKTALLVSLALRLARFGKRVAFFAGEMAPDQVTKRALANWSHVEHWRIRSGNIENGTMQGIEKAAGEMSGLPIFYCGLPSPRLQDIKAMCDACRSDVVIVDYLTRCTLPKAENLRIQVGHFMVGIKNFARETGRIVYLAAQINRLADKAEDGVPTLSDLKESSSIEEESDAVLLLHVFKNDRAIDGPVTLNIGIAKNRHGMTGSCSLVFDKRFMEVEDAEKIGQVRDLVHTRGNSGKMEQEPSGGKPPSHSLARKEMLGPNAYVREVELSEEPFL